MSYDLTPDGPLKGVHLYIPLANARYSCGVRAVRAEINLPGLMNGLARQVDHAAEVGAHLVERVPGSKCIK